MVNVDAKLSRTFSSGTISYGQESFPISTITSRKIQYPKFVGMSNKLMDPGRSSHAVTWTDRVSGHEYAVLTLSPVYRSPCPPIHPCGSSSSLTHHIPLDDGDILLVVRLKHHDSIIRSTRKSPLSLYSDVKQSFGELSHGSSRL